MCSAPKPRAVKTPESKELRRLLPRSYLENSNLAIGGGRVGGRNTGGGNAGSPAPINNIFSGLQIGSEIPRAPTPVVLG